MRYRRMNICDIMYSSPGSTQAPNGILVYLLEMWCTVHTPNVTNLLPCIRPLELSTYVDPLHALTS